MSFVEPSDGARIVVETMPITGFTGLLNGTVQPGDPVYNNGTGWVRAAGTLEAVHGIAVNGGVSGDYVDIVMEAIIDFGSGCTATHGADLFLSDTAGDYSASAGTHTYRIGRMLGAQVAHVWGLHS